jgi:hypothetical protein
MSNTFDQELPTPIHCTIFSAYLEGYDKLEAVNLLNGLSEGFQTGLLKPDTPFGPIILGERLFDPPETIVKRTLTCNLLHL